MKLVIVESPAKAKTISRFLGKEYRVVASFGHVRDLPSSADEIPEQIRNKPWARLAVDTENGFAPFYVVTRESRKHIAELRKHVKEADEVVLATDEDREGESISWHLLETLKPKTPVRRIAFHEITQSAIEEALANPRDLDQDLVRAQESRRVLDRLFGYTLSPVLWKKVRTKLSAGRVQSVAVRLVVEREEERRAFRSSEYWSIDARLRGGDVAFTATLVSLDGKRPAVGRDFDATTGVLKNGGADAEVFQLRGDQGAELAKALQSRVPWRVVRIDQKETRQRPMPPFMTSTLQQAASSLLGMSPRETMQVAQRLYEGVDLGGGEREGLITYMRTDSLTLSSRALAEAGEVIRKQFGDKYYQGTRQYATRSKNAQEAHEAIRPTHLARTPDVVAHHLKPAELALYRLIWNRTIASQMADAVLLKSVVDFEAKLDQGAAVLRANGSVVSFPGYLRVADTAQRDTVLPPLQQGQEVWTPEHAADKPEAVLLDGVDPNEHHTQPPGRYTEASLVQRLEEEGIGRPSTYAPTISTIQQRGYVVRRGKVLVPTFLAIAVVKLLRDHFQEYVDLGFTARMEDALDDISNGQRDATDFLQSFYYGEGQFGSGLVPTIDSQLPEMDFPAVPIGADPESGDPIVVRIGRSAAYLQRGEGGPENMATVPDDVTYEELTVERAMQILRDKARGNEPIGKHPETGEPIFALMGPYGPYVQLGERGEDNPKPKRASLPKDTPLEDVTIEQALRLLSLPRVLGEHPETGAEVSAGLGRFGPYVRCGDEFRSLRPTDDVYTVGLDRALELLAEPKGARRQSKKVIASLGEHPESGAKIDLCEGRYGPFVTDGTLNASIPRDMDPAAVTLEQAVDWLREAAERKPAKRRAKAKPKAKAKAATKAKPKARPKAATKTKTKAKAKPKPKAAPRARTQGDDQA